MFDSKVCNTKNSSIAKKRCSVSKCTRKPEARTYCAIHYSRWNRFGHTYTTRKKLEMHGLSNTSEYNAWRSMKQRCYRKLSPSYKNYGGRGIKICSSWLNSFNSFYVDMGKKPTPKHSIDRIDNNGDYDKNNCRWATARQQAVNQRTNNAFAIAGIVKRIAKNKPDRWIARACLNYKVVHLGVYNTIEEAAKSKEAYEKQHKNR